MLPFRYHRWIYNSWPLWFTYSLIGLGLLGPVQSYFSLWYFTKVFPLRIYRILGAQLPRKTRLVALTTKWISGTNIQSKKKFFDLPGLFYLYFLVTHCLRIAFWKSIVFIFPQAILLNLASNMLKSRDKLFTKKLCLISTLHKYRWILIQ